MFPFVKFPGVDTILGPEMKSTGEVMGVGETFGEAFVKSQLAAGVKLPHGRHGVHQRARRRQAARGRRSRAICVELGFALRRDARHGGGARRRTASPVTPVNKVAEGRPHIVDMIKNGDVSFIVNTVEETRTAIARLARDPHHRARAARHLLHHHRRRQGGLRRHEAPRSQLEPYRLQDLHARLRQADAAMPDLLT